MSEREILEAAKEVLLEQDYVFSTWKSLRIALGLRKGIYEDKKVVEDILRRHSKELLEVYRQIPEPDEGSISEEELQMIKEEVKGGKDRWVRRYRARELVRRLLREKGFRVVDSFVERMVRKVERLLEEEMQGVGV
ncbi:hypothetical protein [Thermocrinis sp.]|jgi:hypothetical protein|uniref:hypothetical protein n=1 Tax=Thermocrinis sp. TaxID=2024383 RepID=UPI003C74ED85